MGLIFETRFFSPKIQNEVKTLTKLINRASLDHLAKKNKTNKTFQMRKCTKICSNHFEYSRPVEAVPNLNLFLKGYDFKIGVKRKAQPSRKNHSQKKIYLGRN